MAGAPRGKKMKTDEEFNLKVVEICESYKGQFDDLYAVVGMMQAGRLFGWRVIRIASRRGHWTLATKLFGDPKQWMPERTALSKKSVGLAIADKLDDYWEVIRGHVSMDKIEKRMIS